MSEFEKIVKNVVYGGIGVAATIVEKGGDIARSLVEKGQETIRANQDTVDQIRETAEDLKRRVREFCERFMDDGVIDASCLTREQRDAVRQQLDEQDALDDEAAAACTYDEPAEDEVPTIVLPEEEEAEQPEPAPVPTIEVVEEPVSDDDVPVFKPEQPTCSAPDEE
ncbi:MAG: hypothetical protein IJE07_04470 [Clostridia bacterium]|nr:hypothetical protein [Clostridia bacterium]